MLRFLVINFLIACIGFGSGTVFISFIYDAYSNYTNVSLQTLDIATSISMALPAPISPKMLGLIAFQEYNFWFVWPAILAFTLPTIGIVHYTFKHYSKFKDNHFFETLAKYFPPIMGAITAYIIIQLTASNLTTEREVIYYLTPMVASFIIRYGFKIKNNGYYLIANIATLIIVGSLIA